MKFLAFFILTFFFGSKIFGQKYQKAIIDSFCNLTLEYYYTDFEKPKDSLRGLAFKPENPYILKSDITENLRTSFDAFTVSYLTKQEILEKICRTKHRTGILYKIRVTQLKDTINIDIIDWTVKVTKVKRRKGKRFPFHTDFKAGCGGTLGYIPTCRFVYDKTTSLWTKYTWEETADAIIKSWDSH